MSPSLSRVRKILITRVDRIGDVVLTTPVFRVLKERFPEAWLAVMVRPETRAIVEGNPSVNEVIVYDKEGKEKNPLRTIAFGLSLRKKRFDLVIHFHPTRRVHWISFLAGIPVRIGYRRKAGWLLTDSLEDKKREGLRHEALYNFDLLRVLGISEPEKVELCFPLKDEDRLLWEVCLRDSGLDPSCSPYVVLNPSASCRSKRWPPDRFAALGDALWARYGFRSVLIGSAIDSVHSENVRRSMKHHPVDLTGKLTLGMLGHCLKGARLLISNDSGPVHIGVACGIPVLSIFGRNQAGLSPRRWGPLGEKSRVVQKDVGCYFCLAHDCRIHFLCLEALGVDEVLHTVQEMEPFFLSEKNAPASFSQTPISAVRSS